MRELNLVDDDEEEDDEKTFDDTENRSPAKKRRFSVVSIQESIKLNNMCCRSERHTFVRSKRY